MGFYCYEQYDNYHSGYVFDRHRGISVFVFVEAGSREAADAIAATKGVVPNRCSCCSDWCSSAPGCEFEPRIDGRSINESLPYMRKLMSPSRPEAYVHFADGTFEGFIYGSSSNLRLERVAR